MKALLITGFLMLFFSLVSIGQGTSITVAHSTKGIYIEPGASASGYNPSIRLSNNASQQLIQGIKKAKEWCILNQRYHKDFQKEIVRFYYMDKSMFQNVGYVQGFAGTGKLIFAGYSNGTSTCFFKLENHGSTGDYLSFSSLQELDKFLKVLQGQSARKDIDAIFK
jgi:hypothetical protein